MNFNSNLKQVRNLYKQHILNIIRLKSEATARQITRESGLQMSVVLSTLKMLEKEGKIHSVGMGKSTTVGGKPPQIWAIKTSYGYIIGLELLSKEIRYIVTNFHGEIICKEKLTFNAKEISSNAVGIITKIFEQITKKHSIPKKQIKGLGLALPGSIDSESGIIRYSYALDFKELNLKKLLSQRFNIPIVIENDANAGAIGSKWHYYQNPEYAHIMYLTINQNFSSMGVGFIVDNKLYRGAHGAAGELSTFITKEIWEEYLIKARLKFSANCEICTFSEKNIPMISDVVSMAKKGESCASYLLKEVANLISKKLVPLVDLFDPQVIVIGGDICEAEELIKDILISNLKKNVISDCVRNTPIYFSKYNTYCVAMGSTALVLKEIFNL